MDRLAEATLDAWGRIDSWVNNAAVFVQGRTEEVEPQEYRRVLDTSLLGTILGTRRAVLAMKPRGEGVIVQVSSIVAERGAALFGAYAASKRGIVGFTQSARGAVGDRRPALAPVPAEHRHPIYQHARGKLGTMPRPAPPVWHATDAPAPFRSPPGPSAGWRRSRSAARFCAADAPAARQCG